MNMEIQNNDRAAELENYLKSRMGSLPYRGLIGDIQVHMSESNEALEVSIIPKWDFVSFGTIRV